MKLSIRRNVFETNSSSMHSVSIRPRNIQSIINPKKMFLGQEDIVVECDNYGWGYDCLNSFEEKLSYVVTTIRYFDNDVEDVEDSTSLRESRYFIWLAEMIKEHTGCDLKIEDGNKGDIDHQSTDTLCEYFSEEENSFKDKMYVLLFDDCISIVVDNDNH